MATELAGTATALLLNLRRTFILNLGAVCLQTKLENGSLISLELTGGEVVKFGCKLPHQANPRSEDRIGIAMWSDAIQIDDPNNWLPK